MNFTITRQSLHNGLAAVSASIPSKTTLPVLSNILFEAKEDGVWMSGTDLDVAVRVRVPADVKEAGSLTASRSLLGIVTGTTLVDGGGNLMGVDPKLGPLAANGGPTRTMALLAGSPAIDTGPNPVPDFPMNQFDQRGDGFARVVNGQVDIGAFEVQPEVPVTPPAPVFIQPKFTG